MQIRSRSPDFALSGLPDWASRTGAPGDVAGTQPARLSTAPGCLLKPRATAARCQRWDAGGDRGDKVDPVLFPLRAKWTRAGLGPSLASDDGLSVVSVTFHWHPPVQAHNQWA